MGWVLASATVAALYQQNEEKRGELQKKETKSQSVHSLQGIRTLAEGMSTEEKGTLPQNSC